MSAAAPNQSGVRTSHKSQRRIRPERVTDIAQEDSQPPPSSELHREPTAANAATPPVHRNHGTHTVASTGNAPAASSSSRQASTSPAESPAVKTVPRGRAGKRRRSASTEKRKEETPAEEPKENEDGSADTPDSLLDDSAEEASDLDLALYDAEDDSQLEERKESDRRPSKKPLATEVDPSAPPIIPFIFNPSHLPSDADRAASAKIVQNRLAEFLNGVELVDKTTAMQRARMSKDRLLQRNLEIQCQ
jgi:hypothetical protein